MMGVGEKGDNGEDAIRMVAVSATGHTLWVCSASLRASHSDRPSCFSVPWQSLKGRHNLLKEGRAALPSRAVNRVDRPSAGLGRGRRA